GCGRHRCGRRAHEGHRPAEATRARRDPGHPRHPRGGRQGDRRAARGSEAHLMADSKGAIWVIAETNADGSLAKSSTEVATLARTLAEAAKTEGGGSGIAA